MEDRNAQRSGSKVLFVIVLVAIGIASGFIFLYMTSMDEPRDILVLELLKKGNIILDAEDRRLLTQQVINVTLEDARIREVVTGKNFTTYVTLIKSLRAIEETPVGDASRRILVEFDYVAIVTLVFEDGSGYKIPVNWDEWTVGEPEYSEQISPPGSPIRQAQRA